MTGQLLALWAFRALAVGGVALVLVLLIRAYRRLTTLRVRLSITLIALVLIVASAISVTSILLGIQVTQRQALDQLETTVRLQEQIIDTWIDQLQYALDSLIVEGYELQRAQALLLNISTPQFRLDARGQLRNRFGRVIERTQWFDEIYLVSPEGVIVLSTDPTHEGRRVADRAYFSQGLLGPYIEPPSYDAASGSVSMVLAQPIRGQFDEVQGVLAARTVMTRLNQILEAGEFGGASRTYLVGDNSIPIVESVLSGGYVPVHSVAVDDALKNHATLTRGTYTSHTGQSVLGVYTWLPHLQIAMITEQSRDDVLIGARRTSFVNAGVAVLAAFLATGAAFYLARDITASLSKLSVTATRIAQGDLELMAEVEREDEVGAVARAFNAMTRQLRDLINSLEARVQERTRGLQAVSEVARTTTSVLDIHELLPQVVNLVRERFGLYYVGLFLLDETGQYAVLRAGTGDAGRQMLAEGWKLTVGGESMIGRSVATGEPVIQQREGDEVVRFANPLLPDTRSELALPLRYGPRIIGAMTVQSREEAIFDDTYIVVLQNMADQVAVAVQNALLFAETQTALEQARRVQQLYQTRAWSEYLQAQPVTGYEYDGTAVSELDTTLLPEVRQAMLEENLGQNDGRLLVPIRQGGQIVGVVGVERDSVWREDDVTFIRSLIEQLALAAENQRLLNETRRREAAERLTREVSSRMREPVDLEDVLRTAAEEIREVFGSDRVVVRLADPRVKRNGG